MTDLPIAAAPRALVARAGAPAPVAQGAQARSGSAPPGSLAFQDALALEVAAGPDLRAPPGPGNPAAAAKPEIERPLGDDAAQGAVAAAAPQVNALAVLALFPAAAPALAHRASSAVAPAPPLGLDSALAPTRQGPSVLPQAQRAAGSERAQAVPEPRAAAPARTLAASQGDAQPASAAPAQSAPAAAESSVRAQLVPASAVEARQAITPDPGLPDEHQAPPAALALIPERAAPAPAKPMPAAALLPAVGERGWNQGLGEQLVWMAGQKHQVAQLHLNPPDLGPLKITLALDGDKASAQFFSDHAVVREAIETAMPRLREMLADNGITLGNANVSAEAFRQPAQQQEQGREARADLAPGPVAPLIAPAARVLRLSLGQVDTFA